MDFSGGLSIDVSGVLKSSTVIVLLGMVAHIFFFLFSPELPVAIFENQHFLPFAASARSVACSPVVAVCASGVTGALLLLLLDFSFGGDTRIVGVSIVLGVT